MKALILNSGLGSRMGALTSEHPKCMTEISNRETILSHQLKMIADAGIEEVSIETGGTFAEALRSPRAWMLVIGYALAGICDYGLLGNYALIAASHGYGDQAGYIMGFSWLAQVFSFIILVSENLDKSITCIE